MVWPIRPLLNSITTGFALEVWKVSALAPRIAASSAASLLVLTLNTWAWARNAGTGRYAATPSTRTAMPRNDRRLVAAADEVELRSFKATTFGARLSVRKSPPGCVCPASGVGSASRARCEQFRPLRRRASAANAIAFRHGRMKRLRAADRCTGHRHAAKVTPPAPVRAPGSGRRDDRPVGATGNDRPAITSPAGSPGCGRLDP